MLPPDTRQKIGLGVVLFFALIVGGGAGPGLFTDSLLQAMIVVAVALVLTAQTSLPAAPVLVTFLVLIAIPFMIILLVRWIRMQARSDQD